MKYAIWPPIVLSGLPLIVYPFILLANVMSFAAETSSASVSWSLWLSAKGFLWSSTLYPIVYLCCAILAFRLSRDEEFSKALTVSLFPFAYLAIVIGLFLAWMEAEG